MHMPRTQALGKIEWCPRFNTNDLANQWAPVSFRGSVSENKRSHQMLTFIIVCVYTHVHKNIVRYRVLIYSCVLFINVLVLLLKIKPYASKEITLPLSYSFRHSHCLETQEVVSKQSDAEESQCRGHMLKTKQSKEDVIAHRGQGLLESRSQLCIILRAEKRTVIDPRVNWVISS